MTRADKFEEQFEGAVCPLVDAERYDDALADYYSDCLDRVPVNDFGKESRFKNRMNSIYQIALRCKSISEEKMGIDRTLIPSRSILFTDYAVKGAIDEYLIAIDALRTATAEKYPLLSYDLKQHKDRFSEDKIVHFSAMKAIVDCVFAIEIESAKRVFISHSSKDRNIVERFVDNILQLGIGIGHEDIFCTSIEDMGIKNGEDIREHIKNNVQSSDFTVLMISKNYKESEICLNEMGAVWAANHRVKYYLLPGVDFKEIGWLCDVKKAEQLNDSVALDSLERELTSLYDLPHRGEAWSRQRQSFLDYLAMK